VEKRRQPLAACGLQIAAGRSDYRRGGTVHMRKICRTRAPPRRKKTKNREILTRFDEAEHNSGMDANDVLYGLCGNVSV